jgi:hypothetical protein
MKLPNGERAIVDLRKLQEYCLNTDHPRGRNKARVFASVGIRQSDAEVLKEALLAAARNADAQPGIANPYGQRYIVDFDLVRTVSSVRVRSTWMSESGKARRGLQVVMYYKKEVGSRWQLLKCIL